ncbi:MAG: protein disulfide-isomerase [Zhongshania aliphaticivorans]|jgi:protein disulfide-isomerase
MKFRSIFIALSLFSSVALVYAGDGWKTNFEAALAEAKSQGKHVLVDFTGSDWCGWCIKLDKEVFSQNAFKQFADDELVLVEIDFPRKKQQSEELAAQNEKLVEQFGIRGFPTILLLSPEGELLEKTGYKSGGAESYIAHIKEIIGE